MAAAAGRMDPRTGDYCICGKSMQEGGTEISEEWRKVLNAVKNASPENIIRSEGERWVGKQVGPSVVALDDLGNGTRGCSECVAGVLTTGCANKEWTSPFSIAKSPAWSELRTQRAGPLDADLLDWMVKKAGRRRKMCDKCTTNWHNTIIRMETEIYWIKWMKLQSTARKRAFSFLLNTIDLDWRVLGSEEYPPLPVIEELAA